jgi:hypothetical protein
MINYFKKGYYYKYIGETPDWCYDQKNMKFTHDKKWHKCVYVDEYWVMFKDMEHDWMYEDYDKKDFLESKCNPYVKKLLEEI